ncbi:DUF349 domain-containing protein [Urechidicola vernalis]|uniref:DUF349 domain-containing protein n=1 Tax=Urechidicola vernalis TaxID=3075600 RepID=A0ABU2Y2I8_9FLAO|nr:DUF349 domain-containing protein [Urechidicola sp. P050]MDT0552424.1 DUF349 domain-containing protein [Urechidicola sp. P050]
MLDATNENLPNESEEINSESENNKPENKNDNASSDMTEEQVVNEIDDQIAETSEKEEEQNEEEEVNYETMELEELVVELEKIINNNEVQKINKQVNSIKNVFNSKFSKILAEKKAQFLAEGGESIDFKYSNPLKTSYNTLVKDFKEKRDKYYKNLETELSGNLDLRLSVIEQLKDLIKNGDSKTMYTQFKGLQERWKRIGPVAREKYNDTWRTYHHHVERFYDLLHLSNDFRDLDFQHNLDEKLKLVKKVEELAEMPDVNAAFKQLQVIHKMWKEDIGPVARDIREEVWGKFSAATKKIHDKRHDYFRGLKGKYEENIEKKLIVIKQIEEVDTSKNNSHNDWQGSIKKIESLRDQFFKIGRVPKSESDKIWDKFKGATKKFNKEKNNFYKNIKGEQQQNLDKKLKLIERAEAAKDSENWEETTELMKKIQFEWKKIGHVPRKYSDKIWNQFRNACNHYFDRFHEYKNEGSKEEQEILNKKKALLELIKTQTQDIEKVEIEALKELIKEWHSLGKVPYSMRHVESKFSKLIDKVFGQLSIDPNELEMMRFKNQIEGFLAQNNFRKLDGEQLYLRKKIDELIREKQQLENNINFFANAKSDNPLLKNVQKNIALIEKKLAGFKLKLTYLSQLDY